MGVTSFWEHDGVYWSGCRWVDRFWWPLVLSQRTELLGCGFSHLVKSNVWVWLLAACFARPRICFTPHPLALYVSFLPHLPVNVRWQIFRVVFCIWLPRCVIVVLIHAPLLIFISSDLLRQLPSLQFIMIIINFFKLSTRECSLKSFSEQAKVLLAILIFRADLSFLLSLRLRNRYAQITNLYSVGVCWHLISPWSDWDEVKGLCSLVYEDTSSETYLCQLPFEGLMGDLMPLGFFFFPHVLSHQIIAVILLYTMVLTSKWLPHLGCILGILTSCTCCCFIGFLLAFVKKSTQQLQAILSVPGLADSKLGFFVCLKHWVNAALCWNVEVYSWYSLFILMTHWSFKFVNYLFNDCNIPVEWSGICVTDLCPKALAQHQWMLRPAQRGLNYTRWIIFPAFSQQFVLLRQVISIAVSDIYCSFPVL